MKIGTVDLNVIIAALSAWFIWTRKGKQQPQVDLKKDKP